MITPHNMSHVINHVSHVTCHMSRVIFHVPCVTCHVSNVMCHIFFSDKAVKLIGGVSFINGAYPVYFKPNPQIRRGQQGSIEIEPKFSWGILGNIARINISVSEFSSHICKYLLKKFYIILFNLNCYC